MKMLPLQTGLMTSLLCLSFSASAGSLTVTNDFVSGTAAVAADVNQNFTDVETAVNDNDTRTTANAAHVAGSGADHADVATNTTHSTGNGADHANVATNTTHSTGNGADHANVATNTTHSTGNGADHANVATNTTHSTGNGADHANVATNTTHSTGDGSDHADVATNTTHSTGDGSDHADVGTNTTNIGTNSTAITALQQNTFSCAGDPSGDMVRVGPICVDVYEASVWDLADGTDGAGGGANSGTQYGLSDNYDTSTPACLDNGESCSTVFARSDSGVTPSRFISWYQAAQACANSGKRLLTNAEWQMAVAGTVDPGSDNGASGNCNTNSSIRATGGGTSCVSRWAVEDMIGNAYEIVADWVQGSGSDMNSGADGTFASSRTTGVSSTASADDSGSFGSDQNVGMNTVPSGNRTNPMMAMLLRGGAFDGTTGAGAFAIRADFSPDFTGNGVIGFRCAR